MTLPVSPAFWRRPRQSVDRVRQFQDEAVSRLVLHAYQNVPFYGRLYRSAGIDPSSIRGVEDLARLPAVNKADLQDARWEDRFSKGVDRNSCRIYETSGSSGEPLRIARTHAEDARLFAVRLRAQSYAGLRPWHRRVCYGASPKLFSWHRVGLYRTQAVDLAADPQEVFQQLLGIQPDVLRGPPGSLDQLIDAAGGRVGELRPKLVFTGAEQLPGSARSKIERAFGRAVTDFYGTTECNLIAWQCTSCRQYHSCDDAVVLETPNEESIVTALHSYAMPFIRYRVGDAVRRPANPSRCGIGFGSVQCIDGRLGDFLTLPDGSRMSPYLLMDQIDEMDGVGRYLAEQQSCERLLFRFVPVAGAVTSAVAAEVERRLRALFPPAVHVEVLPVDRWPHDGATKRRFIRSTPKAYL